MFGILDNLYGERGSSRANTEISRHNLTDDMISEVGSAERYKLFADETPAITAAVAEATCAALAISCSWSCSGSRLEDQCTSKGGRSIASVAPWSRR